MIIYATDQKTFINSNAVKCYKIVGTPEEYVLRAYITKDDSEFVARGAHGYLVETMNKISEAINRGEPYYEIE